MWLAPLPASIRQRFIALQIDAALRRRDYFVGRSATGKLTVPDVFQPVFEPDAGLLIAIFVEPGATHLVFGDEVAPNQAYDKEWREARMRAFGRTKDIESIEFFDGTATFALDSSFLSVYELSFHFTSAYRYDGRIYTDTWNHLMSTGGHVVIFLRGGYKQVSAPVFTGGRADAEAWART